MVIKTENCSFSQFKIYPGHGSKLIRVDNKIFLFASSKCERCHYLKRNPRETAWTVVYRRLNRKGHVEEATRRRTRRTTRVQRAIVGASLTDIAQKKANSKSILEGSRTAALAAAKKEIQGRKKK